LAVILLFERDMPRLILLYTTFFVQQNLEKLS